MLPTQEGLYGLAGSRGRAELYLLLCSVALNISVALVILMASVVYRWVLELGCPGGCLHHPLQPGMGRLLVHPIWTLHPCRQAACGTLSLVAMGSCRDVGELYPSELKSKQPQIKHPKKLSGQGSW